jgi:hypothetical protein
MHRRLRVDVMISYGKWQCRMVIVEQRCILIVVVLVIKEKPSLGPQTRLSHDHERVSLIPIEGSADSSGIMHTS